MEALLDELMALVKTQQKKCRRHGLTEEINEVKSRILKRADLVDGLVEALKTIASGTEDPVPPFRVMPACRMQGIAKDALAALKD